MLISIEEGENKIKSRIKPFIIIISLFLITLPAHASELSDLIEKADSAFHADDYETAVELYKQALEIDPSDYMAWINLGFSLTELERYDESMKCYEKAVELGAPFNEGSSMTDEARELYYKGNDYQNSGKYKEAIVFYEQANKKDPYNGVILQAMGWSYKKDGDNVNAEKEFKRAIRVDPLFSYPYGSLGYIYYDSNSLMKCKHFYSIMLIIGIDDLEIKKQITERLKECERLLKNQQ